MPMFVPRALELQIATAGLAGHEPASPDPTKKDAEATSTSTPLSQASTAPATPDHKPFRLPIGYSEHPFDEEHFPLLTRQLSIPEDEEECFDSSDSFQAFYFRKHSGHDVEHDMHAASWPKGGMLDCDHRVESLQQKLAEVKRLYTDKYGAEVDEDDDVQYDADGTPWVQTSGTGIPTDSRVDKLEKMLLAVKDMFSQKYGRDVDTEYDEDGTAWNVTQGTGVPRDCRVVRLEQKLAEVKQLYALKYGTEVDEDDDVQYDADGTPWIQTTGTGIPTDSRVDKLEKMLWAVKDMYSQKYGRDVDTEYDEDGTAWNVTQGTGVPRDCRVERLEQKLAEVKQLYALKYGTEVDEDDVSNVGDFMYDSDGTLWIKSVTTGPCDPDDFLGEMMQEVRDLCKQRFEGKERKESEEPQNWTDDPSWHEMGGSQPNEGASLKDTCGLQ